MKTHYILLVLIALVIAGCGSPPEDVARAEIVEQPVQQQQQEAAQAAPEAPAAAEPAAVQEVPISVYEFEFEGYKPGGSHVGSFEEGSGVLYLAGGTIVGAKGTIQAASVTSDHPGVTKHLKNDDFFDVEKFPTIEFESDSIVDGVMTGPLTFHGHTHDVSFPVVVSDTSLSADFMLDTTPFEMKHAGVNKEVRITFTMKI